MKEGQTRLHTQRNDDEEHKYHKARAEIKEPLKEPCAFLYHSQREIARFLYMGPLFVFK